MAPSKAPLSAYPTASNSSNSAPCSGSANSYFGFQVAMFTTSANFNNSFVLSGAPYYYYLGVAGTGAAYFYTLLSESSGSGVWSLAASFISPSTYLSNSYALRLGKTNAYASNFGYSVSLFGSYAIIGAPQYCENHYFYFSIFSLFFYIQ
jgi:hypothetical protein